MKLRELSFRNHVCGKLKNVHNFGNLGNSDFVASVCLELVSIHICVI